MLFGFCFELVCTLQEGAAVDHDPQQRLYCIAEIYLHPKWQFSRKLNDSGQSERTLLLFERLSP